MTPLKECGLPRLPQCFPFLPCLTQIILSFFFVCLLLLCFVFVTGQRTKCHKDIYVLLIPTIDKQILLESGWGTSSQLPFGNKEIIFLFFFFLKKRQITCTYFREVARYLFSLINFRKQLDIIISLVPPPGGYFLHVLFILIYFICQFIFLSFY